LALIVMVSVLFAVADRASAAPVLTVTPITWNVVGLDSNKVTDGTDTFPVGVRACNVGNATASNVQATMVWDSVNALISLSGPSVLTEASVAAGACSDFYFNVKVSRSASAYDTTRAYHVNVTATGVAAVSTPANRELYVEHLVSQNRNFITQISGAAGVNDPAPTTVYVGQT